MTDTAAAIVTALGDGPATVRDLSQRVDGIGYANIRQTLRRLAVVGVVTKLQRGLYGIADCDTGAHPETVQGIPPNNNGGGRHTRFFDHNESAASKQLPARKQSRSNAFITVRLSGCYRAEAEGIVVDYEKRRRGSPICALARELIEAGHCPSAEMHIYRGDTLCFLPRPLGLWAGLTVAEGDDSDRPAHFVRYRPPPSARRSARSCRCPVGFNGRPGVSGIGVPETANAAVIAGATT